MTDPFTVNVATSATALLTVGLSYAFLSQSFTVLQWQAVLLLVSLIDAIAPTILTTKQVCGSCIVQVLSSHSLPIPKLNVHAVKYHHIPLILNCISYNPIRHNVYLDIPYSDEIRECTYLVLSPWLTPGRCTLIFTAYLSGCYTCCYLPRHCCFTRRCPCTAQCGRLRKPSYPLSRRPSFSGRSHKRR